MIGLQQVSFAYPKQPVLKDFSLTVGAGESVCLFGPSGCGKTTVLRLILGLEQADNGTVETPEKISCVFQEDRLLPHLNVMENVCLPLSKEQRPFAEKLLEEMGLGEEKRSRLSTLSGGMRRRVAICRAIAFGGDALVLDEPFNGIDLENKEQLAPIIRREFTEKGKPVVLVSHILQDAQLLDATIINM